MEIPNENKNADPLAEWCSRELNVKMGTKIMVLKPTMKHYKDLRALQKEVRTAGEATDDTVLKQRDIFKEMLKTTFPNSQLVDDFLEVNEELFLQGLYVAMGWVTEDGLVEAQKNFVSQELKQSP